ncbi:hypothetical protein [Campylobacter rectus]|uniref:hypothetical protein n=1 Tax=Campylobacter rectus TaxID=203 RepID=UPI000F5E158E|nr:hypothetical protein [Campylobacter rectus]RRD54964.1 hypothetical protein EII16_03320 [Campylobacter rectus]
MKTSVCADKAKIKLAQPSATKRQAREMPSSQGFYGCLKDTKILKRPQGIKIKNSDSKRCKLGKNEIWRIWGA